MSIIPLYIEEMISVLENDAKNGSVQIALNALDILFLSIKRFKRAEETGQIETVADMLIHAKPTMSAVKNIIEAAMYGLSNISNYEDFPLVVEKIKLNIEKASLICRQTALNEIFSEKNKVLNIFTCSYSGSVLNFFKYAKISGKKFKVSALNSAWNSISYGGIMVLECKNNEIKAEIIDDNNIEASVAEADVVLCGADKILAGGSAVNGYPSENVAAAARGQTPFYIIAESFKYSENYYAEDGYEYVPKELISAIFTDDVFIKK